MGAAACRPILARAAFEEATRYDSSSQSLFRTTLEDIDFQGVPLEKHQKVLVLIGAAGHDARRGPIRTNSTSPDARQPESGTARAFTAVWRR